MELFLNRTRELESRTCGDLFVEFVFFCHTVEDKVREVSGRPVEEWKIDGQTAIPRGRYRLTLENSPRFGPNTITLQDVPGFTSIRMHGGNDETHTEGCPLLGYELTPDGKISAGQSRMAVENLKRVIRECIIDRGEQVWINLS